jgi:hypothetical protein
MFCVFWDPMLDVEGSEESSKMGGILQPTKWIKNRGWMENGCKYYCGRRIG